MSEYNTSDEQWAMNQPSRAKISQSQLEPDVTRRVSALARQDAAGEIALLRERIESLEQDKEVLLGLVATWTTAAQLAQEQVFKLSESLRRICDVRRTFTRASSTAPERSANPAD